MPFDLNAMLNNPSFLRGAATISGIYGGEKNPIASGQEIVRQMEQQKLAQQQMEQQGQMMEMQKANYAAQAAENTAQAAARTQTMERELRKEALNSEFMQMVKERMKKGGTGTPTPPPPAPALQPVQPDATPDGVPTASGWNIPPKLEGFFPPADGVGKYGTPGYILRNLAQTESSFNPTAVGPVIPGSRERAMGLMQFLPSTAKQVGINAFDPKQAIDGADKYIQELLAQHGSYEKALAAYGGHVKTDPSPYLRKVLYRNAPGDGIVPAGGIQQAQMQQPPQQMAQQQTAPQQVAAPQAEQMFSQQDAAELGVLGGLANNKLMSDAMFEYNKAMKPENVSANSYRVTPDGKAAYYPDPLKEREANFKMKLDEGGMPPAERVAMQKERLMLTATNLEKNYEKLNNVPQQLLAIRAAREATAGLKGSNYQGMGADVKLGMTRAINSAFGWAGVNIDVSDLTNAAKLESALFVPVMLTLKSIDSNPTEKQQEMLKKMMGSLSTSPEALPKLLDMAEERLTYGVKTHNSRLDRADAEGAPVSRQWRVDTLEDLNQKIPSKAPITPKAPQAWQPPQGWKFQTR